MMQNSPILISLVFLSTLSALGGCEDPDALTGELAGLDGLELQDEQHGDAILEDLEAQDDNQHVDAQGPASLSAPRPDPLESGSFYYPSKYITSSGGGTWGPILRLELFKMGPSDSNIALFKITKTDGSAFTTSGTISMRQGSSNGAVVLGDESETIYAGESGKAFYFDFNHITWTKGTSIDFYGRVVNNSGIAYVGPIRVTKGY